MRVGVFVPARPLPRPVGLIWGAWTLLIAAGFIADAAGLRLNTTASMPLGLWRITPANRSLHAGDIVLLCPPDVAVFREAAARGYIPRGRCAGGFAPLIKPVAAIAGDVVSVGADGVAVNGAPITGTAPLDRDSAGRPLQPLLPGRYAVATGEVWLVSAHIARSWDSRYFGAAATANILGLARPVWVLR